MNTVLRQIPVFICILAYAASAWAMPYPAEPQIPEDKPITSQYQGWQAKRERVFIIHDLFAMSRDTGTIATGFRHAGFMVDNLGYNPLGIPVDGILPVMVKELNARMQNYTRDDRLHFVCYAMGCVLMHGLIYEHRPQNLGNVLMIAAPPYFQWLVERRDVSGWALDHPRLAGANKLKLEQYINNPIHYDAAALTGTRITRPRETVTVFKLDGQPHREHQLNVPAISGSVPLRIIPAAQDDLRTHPDVIAEAVYYIENGRFRP